MISWVANLWFAFATVRAEYISNLLLGRYVYNYDPAVIYDPSWTLVYPVPNPATNVNNTPGSLGYGWGAYQSNATGTNASFSIPFYGRGFFDMSMALTPLDETLTTLNMTLSLDGTTWTVPVDATLAANISSATWPVIDLGPLALTPKSTNRLLKVSVSDMVATFRYVEVSFGIQTDKYVYPRGVAAAPEQCSDWRTVRALALLSPDSHHLHEEARPIRYSLVQEVGVM